MLDDLKNDQSEIEILGRIIRDPKLMYIVASQINSTDFHDRKNRMIFDSMKSCIAVGKPVEIGIMSEHLDLKKVSVIDLVTISGSVASTSDIQFYIDIVKESGKKKNLEIIFKKALSELKDKSSKEVAEAITNDLYQISSDVSKDSVIGYEQMMNRFLDHVQDELDSDGKSTRIKTGWRSIDRTINGLNRGDLILLGARPSMGKTTFALNMLTKIAESNKIMIFELEMQHLKLGYRQVSAKSGIHMDKLYSMKTMTPEQISAMYKAVADISMISNATFDDAPKVTLGYIRQKIHYIKEIKGLDVVIIDHIGLIKMDKGFNSRNDWIGEVSSSFKAMAKEFDINIIILSQLNRGLETRLDKRPMLSDLRDSGNLEQDADVVMFLYREGYYNDEITQDLEPLEVLVAKNRDGATGTVKMAINLKIQKVTEIKHI